MTTIETAAPAMDSATLMLFRAWAKANHIELIQQAATATRPAQITAEQVYGHDREIPTGQLLTLRELQVLAGMSLGMTNEEVAAKLYLSVDTVKTHARHLFRKIGVRNRTQAAVVAPQFIRGSGGAR